MQNLLETNSLSWAQTVRIARESEGVHAVVLDQYAPAMHSFTRIRVAVADDDLPKARAIVRTEQVTHQLVGVAFAVGAVTLALAQTGRLPGRLWEGLWAALLLVVGVALTVSYRLTPLERSMEVSSP